MVHVRSRSKCQQAPAVDIDFDNRCGEKAVDAGEAYGLSKLADAPFSLALAERLWAVAEDITTGYLS